jgi:hypothetical protein
VDRIDRSNIIKKYTTVIEIRKAHLILEVTCQHISIIVLREIERDCHVIALSLLASKFAYLVN